LEEQLSLEFLRVVENGAIAAARTMGVGDRHKADEVAVEAMRKTMDAVPMDGTIVIGEGERDEAPMLYIGEKVGLATHAPKALFPEVDIAVDPLEGTKSVRDGCAGAIAVLAASEKGGLLHAPDVYMEKSWWVRRARRGRSGCAGGRQSESDREAAGSRRGRSDDYRAGPAAARKN